MRCLFANTPIRFTPVRVLKQTTQKIFELKKQMWIKRDWIENKELLDKFKPLGFDLLYSKEDLLIV